MRHHKQQKFSEFAHWFQKKENKVQSWTPSKIQTQEHHAQSAQSNRQSGHNGYDTQTPKNVVELVFE